MLFAFAIGAVGNVVGSTIAGTPTVWDLSVGHALTIVLGNLVSLSIGTMLGMLLRSSAGGLVMYFVLVLLVPNLTSLLAASQDWFEAPAAVGGPALRADLPVRGDADRRPVGARRHRLRPLDRPARVLRAPRCDALRGEVASRVHRGAVTHPGGGAAVCLCVSSL